MKINPIIDNDDFGGSGSECFMSTYLNRWCIRAVSGRSIEQWRSVYGGSEKHEFILHSHFNSMVYWMLVVLHVCVCVCVVLVGFFSHSFQYCFLLHTLLQWLLFRYFTVAFFHFVRCHFRSFNLKLGRTRYTHPFMLFRCYEARNKKKIGELAVRSFYVFCCMGQHRWANSVT